MRVFQDLNNLPDFKNSVITVGSFDGVHLGHQRILDRVKSIARGNDGESIVITFHPHPRSIIYPKDKSLRLISTLEEKISLFERYGVDNLVIVPFTVEFSQISPAEYIEKFLFDKFHPSVIVIGYDHRFGLNRAGSIESLKYESERYGYKVEEISKLEIDDIAISSTKIRTAILEGDITRANNLLNHHFILSGKVVEGKKLGRQIGYPTANIAVDDPNKIIPGYGIYACYVGIEDHQYKGMMYIGESPTIDNSKQKTIEVNVFDFDAEIYDSSIRLGIVKYLRDDEKFDSLDELKSQLNKDKLAAISFFEQHEFNVSEELDTNKLTVSILNYNTKSFLESFLPSLTYSYSSQFNIQIIDNASQDDSVAYVNEWFPEVDILQLNKNYGFAGGYNKGLEHIDTEYIALVNSDIQSTASWLDGVIQFLDNNPDYAAAMPKILSFENREQFEYAGAAGGYMDALGYPFCRGRLFDTVESDSGQYDDHKDIFWASGAAMVVRTKVFKLLSGFDEDYFAHQEEIDLCWRMQLLGYKIAVIPKSIVYHVGGGTMSYDSPRKLFLNFRNSLSNLFKNESFGALLWKLPMRLILDGVAGIQFLMKGQFIAVLQIIKAHFAFYVRIPSLISKRRELNKLITKYSIVSQSIKLNGYLSSSIVFQYYIKGRKTFDKIKFS